MGVILAALGGWWALYVPAAPLGLALYRSACRPVPSPSERKLTKTITIGIDPHKGSHTAVAIDSTSSTRSESDLALPKPFGCATGQSGSRSEHGRW
jgi:hypothetical protein